MTTIRTGKTMAWLAVIALLAIAAVQVQAQGKKKKPAASTAAAMNGPADSTQGQLAEYDSTHYRYFLFPQFYTYWPIENNDTTLKFQSFDAGHNFINMDTSYNIGSVANISFVKTYTDYTQTTIDAEGKPRPVVITKKLYNYDRTGADTWTALDLINNYTSLLKEFRNDIVRTDTTTITDRLTGLRQITIRKYYRTQVLDSTDDNGITYLPGSTPKNNIAAEPVTTKTAAGDNKTIVTVYTVPEFYYYGQKAVRDTLFEFKSYDSRDSLIDHVDDYDSVRYFSLFKSFIDSNHTYRDADGKKKPLPISTIVRRYDRMSRNRWMSIEYPSNKYMELTEYRNVIVKSDTVTLMDPISDVTYIKVFNQYKLVK